MFAPYVLILFFLYNGTFYVVETMRVKEKPLICFDSVSWLSLMPAYGPNFWVER